MRSDVASAEMIKLAANAALMTRISFINEIANVCEATGADVVKVAEGIGHDRRIGKSFLQAGVGFGGSCFPKDSLALKQLAANSGYHFQVLNAVIEVNELQKRRVIGKLHASSSAAPRQRIALLGLAFKPDTDDTRESPAFVLAGRLLAEGATSSRGTRSPRRTASAASSRSARVAEAVRDADAVVLVTEWPELPTSTGKRSRRRCAAPSFVDGRNMLDPDAMRAAGFRYDGDRPRRRTALPDGGDRPRGREGGAPRRRRGRHARSRSCRSADARSSPGRSAGSGAGRRTA